MIVHAIVGSQTQQISTPCAPSSARLRMVGTRDGARGCNPTSQNNPLTLLL